MLEIGEDRGEGLIEGFKFKLFVLKNKFEFVGRGGRVTSSFVAKLFRDETKLAEMIKETVEGSTIDRKLAGK